MTTIYQSNEANPTFFLNPSFMTKFSPNKRVKTRLREPKKLLIKEALLDRDVQSVYMRAGKLFKFLLNGCEVELKEPKPEYRPY